MIRLTTLVSVAVGSLLSANAATAHSPAESYLQLSPGVEERPSTGRWEVALRDLDDLLSLDADGNGAITRGEVLGRSPEISGRLLSGLQLSGPAGVCVLQGDSLSLTTRSGIGHAALALTFRCPPASPSPNDPHPAPSFLEVDYRLLLDHDRLHRGILQLTGPTQETAVVRAGQSRHRFSLSHGDPASRHGATLSRFVKEGVVHIWLGPDHLLFLLVLLLPAVLRRQPQGWVAATDLRGVMRQVLKVVTAFTGAHSLTLALSALGVVHASPAVIEPAIAASVLLAAASNLSPALAARLGGETWAMAFGLGLLHGFGFSSVLAELGLPEGSRLAALVGFNLGVELGQLALVLPFVPLAFALRRTRGYRLVGLQLGSGLTALVATLWLVERTL